MTSAYREGCESCAAARQVNEALQVANRTLKEELDGRDEQLRALRGRRIGAILVQMLGYLGGAGAILLGLTVVGAYVHGCAIRPDLPEQPKPCQESAEIVTTSSSQRTCHPDATMSLDRLQDNQMLVRCKCPRKVVEPGASAGAPVAPTPEEP